MGIGGGNGGDGSSVEGGAIDVLSTTAGNTTVIDSPITSKTLTAGAGGNGGNATNSTTARAATAATAAPPRAAASARTTRT